MVSGRGEGAQYCSFCGRELEVWKQKSAIDKNIYFVWLRCPGDKWYKFWEWDKHRAYIARMEVSETILNYDPFTGERIKRDKRAK